MDGDHWEPEILVLIFAHDRSDPESEHSEQSSDDLSKQDERNDSDMEDTDNAHIPKVSTTTWFKPIPERRMGKKKLCNAGLKKGPPTLTLFKAFHKRRLHYPISQAQSVVTSNFGLEELVPSVVALRVNANMTSVQRSSGITHLFIKCQSVCEKYGYNFLRGSFFAEADYQEYKISEKDFKNLHPNDFEDLFLLNIQEKLNHLPKTDKTSLHTAVNMWIRNLVIRNRVGDLQLGIESYQTKVNLERPNWDAADYYFKEDYTIVPKPRAVVYRDRNNQRKLMRLNELHKFSDGTLTRVMEKLDQMVKDFHLFEYNKGMETRKWSEDDKRRSKDFITAIEKRLQIRRIYRSLESFVGGRAETRVQFLCCQNPLKMNADIEDRHLDSQWMQYTTLPQHSESFNKISVSFSRSLNTLSNKLSHYEFVDIEKGGAVSPAS
ncbi:hypothetical protein Tco_1236538 [Tanacetum coccineum]